MLSHQLVSICRVLSNILINVPVYHHLRYHRELASERVGIDSDKLQKVGMGDVHPGDTFLAEALDCMGLR